MVCLNLKKDERGEIFRLEFVSKFKYGQIVVKQIVKRLIVVIVINLRILIHEGYIAR
jgi:hypothetical protein